jgi:hypothetical protein
MTRYRIEPGETDIHPDAVSALTEYGITLTPLHPPTRYIVDPSAASWVAVVDRDTNRLVVMFKNDQHPYPVTAATAEADRLNLIDAAEEHDQCECCAEEDTARFYWTEEADAIRIHDRNGSGRVAQIRTRHPGAAEAAEAMCSALNRWEIES